MPPSIDLFGLVISEPTTTLTDYLITLVASYFGVCVRHSAADRAGRLWGHAFLFIALAAFLGGTSHGFASYLGAAGNIFLWKSTVYAIGLSMLCAVAGTIDNCPLDPRVARLLHSVNVAAFVIYAAWMVGHDSFRYVIYHYVPAMLAIALLHAWLFIRHRKPGSRWVIAGVVVTLLGAVIQQSGFSVHRQFNNNDLYHVIQIVGLYLLFRGVSAYGR